MAGKDVSHDQEPTPEQLAAIRVEYVKGITELTPKGLGEYLSQLPPESVIIMQGAGISVAAGIPDFRTPGTGLYDNLQRFNLPRPEAIFTLDYFEQNPLPFFQLAKEMWGGFKPTPAHYLGRLLEEKGLLRRLYTQNIDGLELQAGVSPERLVEAHGTVTHSTCLKCGATFGAEETRAALDKGEVWRHEGCDGLIKPDIVFFGEGLPPRFFQSVQTDFEAAKLLIVIGTSLKVQPFAGLIRLVPETEPRILFNREMVGQIAERMVVVDGKVEDRTGSRGFRFGHHFNRRDVFVPGDCQESVPEFITACGWRDEFLALLPPETRAMVK